METQNNVGTESMTFGQSLVMAAVMAIVAAMTVMLTSAVIDALRDWFWRRRAVAQAITRDQARAQEDLSGPGSVAG